MDVRKGGRRKERKDKLMLKKGGKENRKEGRKRARIK